MVHLIFFLLLGYSVHVQAQMADLLGTLALQGQLSTQSVKGYNSASVMLEKNQLSQELQLQVIEIKQKFINKEKIVSRETFSTPLLKKYQTQLKKEQNEFYFELLNINEKLCKILNDGFADSIKIDNNNCKKIKIYYEFS